MGKDKYYIIMDAGERLYFLGINGKYETEISKAVSFEDKYDALVYVERHGIEKISYIRKFCSH